MTDPSIDPSLAPPEHSRAGTIFAFTFLTIGVVVAAVFVSIAAVELHEQKRAMTEWASVLGEVVVTEIETVRTSGGSSTHGSQSSTTYKPVVRYRYTVDGHRYTSPCTTPLDSAGSHEWAYGIISRYAPEEPVEVYHNPDDPSESFVVRHWEDKLMLVAVFASFFPCFIAFLFTAGGMKKYALKWTLPAMGTAVYALGTAASAGLYFGTVPMRDVTSRAWYIFGAGTALLLVAAVLTVVWRHRHMEWRRTEGIRLRREELA